LRNTTDLILSLFLLVLLTGFASAQEAGTFHVFPMVTAGELPDGSEWDGSFIVTNVDGRPTTCSLELIGMPLTNTVGRGSLASQGSVQRGELEAGRVPPGVEVGYGIITCDLAVTATFLQVFDPVGEAPPPDGLTMINPAARSLVASIPLLGNTMTVAIVNDTSAAADFDVTVFSDQLVGTTRVNIAAKTQLVEEIANLVQELSAAAEDFAGSIRISSVDNSTPFYALGMFRNFTQLGTVAATQLETTSPKTVLVAIFLNGNNAVLSSRVYLFNGSDGAGDVTVRVFTTPTADGIRQELTPDPFPLGNLGPKEAMNIKLAEDILDPLGVPLPYTEKGGNLTAEFTIGAENVHGVAQVFSSELAFGTYPMQVIQ